MNPSRRDFPYYDGAPVPISGRGWLIVMAAVVAAFLLLTLLPLKTFPLNVIPAAIFTLMPIAVLMSVTGWRSPAIFRPLGLKGVLAGIGFALLTIVCSFAAGAVFIRYFPTAPNPAVTALADFGSADLFLFLTRIAIQLIGEELVTILPLLAVLWFCVHRMKLSRRSGLFIAVLVSTLWFSALHLPTYDWNLLQCVATIGTARLILTLAYLVTRNLWVSSIAHIANDWSLFVVAFAGGHLPIGTEGLI